MHSNHSQQCNISPIQANNTQVSDSKEEVFENTFIVKKQKNCNFCGAILPYPNKFTFSRKCQRCSMKNSALLLPARFLCNMCIDGCKDDLYQCQNDQIPLDSIKSAKSLQSSE